MISKFALPTSRQILMHGPFQNLKFAQPLGTRAENQKFDWSTHQILNGSGICHGYRALVKFVEIWFSKSDIWMTSEICFGSLQNLGNSASNQILSSIATYLQAFWGGGRKQQNSTITFEIWNLKSEIKLVLRCSVHLKSEIWNLKSKTWSQFAIWNLKSEIWNLIQMPKWNNEIGKIARTLQYILYIWNPFQLTLHSIAHIHM